MKDLIIALLMKDLIKLALIVVAGAFAAALPFYGFYSAWSWAMSQVPMTSEWAGLIKVGVTLLMVLVGGGATVTIAFFGGLLSAKMVAAIVD